MATKQSSGRDQPGYGYATNAIIRRGRIGRVYGDIGEP
jgi:hypothetical protein